MNKPLLLFIPDEGELLYVYFVVSKLDVSLVLLKEVNEEQRPIYFINKTFTDFQTRYLSLEKLVITLFISSRKLI